MGHSSGGGSPHEFRSATQPAEPAEGESRTDTEQDTSTDTTQEPGDWPPFPLNK